MEKNKESKIEPEDKYRGVAVDQADDEKVTPKMVKEDVKELNNNPHSEGL
mgnify:CR=1 FL=1